MKKSKILTHICFVIFAVYQAVKWSRNVKKIDYIITYDPFSAGFIGWIISLLTKAKLVVEVNGNYGERKTWGADRGNLVGKIKYHYCQFAAPFIINRCYGVKLLYKDQLVPFSRPIKNTNICVFHDFVPVSDLTPSGAKDDYILFLGRPWYGKGVDLLIKAYNEICHLHSGYLKIVGHFPPQDLTFLNELKGDNDKISIEPAVFYEQAQELIDRCDFLVLPSRTEAMGRVLLEAMAHKKALIGSTADGIPTYITHGENGLLFESGNWRELAKVLGQVVSDDDLNARMAENGYNRVFRELSEAAYLKNYKEFLGEAAGDYQPQTSEATGL